MRTEFNGAVVDNKIWGIRPIIDLSGFVQEFKELFGVDKGLVDGAVDVSEHVQGTVQLIMQCQSCN